MKPVNFQDLGSSYEYTHYMLVVPYFFLTTLFSQWFLSAFSPFLLSAYSVPPLLVQENKTQTICISLDIKSLLCFSSASIPSPTFISDEDYILCDSIYIISWKRWNCPDRNQIYGFQGLDVSGGDWVLRNVLLEAMEISYILIVWCLHDCRGLLKFAELHVFNKSEWLCI